MTKRIIIVFMIMTMIAIQSLSANASEVFDLKINFPDVMTATSGKKYQISIPFSGKGIDRISFKTEGVKIELIDADWHQYPESCFATIQLCANDTGRFTMQLVNNNKGIVYEKDFIVIIGSYDTVENEVKYVVNHKNGVNLRSLPNTSSNILCTLSQGTKFDVTISQNEWAFVEINGMKGFVCLKYCTESNNTYDPSKALDFASKYAYEDKNWKCSEFVSRSLQSGGLEIDVYTGVGNLYRALDKMEGVEKYELTVNKNGRVYPQDNKGKLASGDVICLYCRYCASPKGDGRPYVHAVMVGDLSEDGIKVYAKNNNYKNELYSGFNHCICGSHDVIAYVFHF